MFHGAEMYSAIFWGAIVCFVLIGSFFRYKTRESEHRMLERLAEKGQTISSDLLSSISREDHRKGGGLRAGIVLMAVGIGVAFMLWAMTGGGGIFQGDAGSPNWLPTVGAIPFLIGLALFLTGLFERRDPK